MKRLVDKFGKKKLIIGGTAVVIVVVAAVVCGVWFWKSNDRGAAGRNIPQMPGMGEDVIAASGLTATGMTEEKYELDFLETALYVEESYLSMGDTVEAGEAVFKVSEETLTQAREELEKAATEADLAYRQGAIDYETQRLEAESTHAQAEINKEYAQAEYDSALEQAKKEVDTLTEQVEEAQELYDEYKAVVENDYYYTYYEVGELKQVYYDNFTYLMELYEKWDIEGLKDQYPNAGSSGMAGSSGSTNSSVTSGSSMTSGSSVTSDSSKLNLSARNGSENDSLNTDIMMLNAQADVAGDGIALVQLTASNITANGNDSETSGSADNTDSTTNDNNSGSNGSTDSSDSTTNDSTGDADGDSTSSGSNGGTPNGGGAPGGMSGSGMPGGMSGGSFYSEGSGKLSVYEMLDELVQKNGEEYETALENYEKDTKMAKASLESARSELAKLQAELAEANLVYEKQVIVEKTNYETTIAESENAQLVYETQIKKLDEELEALKDEKEETEENLTLFEETIGDGYFYTGSAGTVMMNMVRAGNYLSGESILIAYSDPNTVTVAASVSQDDIAKIAVGDSAYVMITEYGNYEGTVTSIDPVSSSDSRSSVTYTVTVELTGDIESLESNLTAYVYFGMSEEAIRMSNGEQPGDGKMPGEREQAEDGKMPGSGEQPKDERMSGDSEESKDAAQTKSAENPEDKEQKRQETDETPEEMKQNG